MRNHLFLVKCPWLLCMWCDFLKYMKLVNCPALMHSVVS